MVWSTVEVKLLNLKNPWIIKNFFPEEKYRLILKGINSIGLDSWTFDRGFNRYIYQSTNLHKLSLLELDRARKEFQSSTLLYTYSLLSLYNQNNSFLKKHKDDNACTYTIDICLYSEKPWPIIVEDKEYILQKNEALCFYGEDQLHWRPPIEPDNKVLMLFMHWAEPNHIFFQEASTKI